MKRCIFFLSLLLVALISSCSSSPAPSPKEGRFLRIGFLTEVCSLDPRLGIDNASEIVIRMLFEGLMGIDLKGSLVPGIAESFDLSEDQKTYTFHLRPCQWSNGEEVTAHDFAYAWKKIVSSPAKGLTIQNYYLIKNVKAILQGKKGLDEVGIHVLDDKTLQVELEHPTGYFLEALATSSFFPINARIDQVNPHWASQKGAAFVSNGPFVLKEHRENNEIIVVKNPRYWDVDRVRLPGIKLAIVKDALTQLNMFEKNELDWIGKPLSKLPLDAIPSLKKQGKLNFVPSMGIYWYFINTRAFPFNHKKMRQAFAYAINRQEITHHVLQEGEKPALAILPSSLGGYGEPYFEDANHAEAKRLFKEALDELGISKEQLPIITLNYNDSEYHQRVAQVVQEQWHKTFGITVRLVKEEWKVHYQKLVQGDFQIGGMGWDSWLRDPIYIMQTFRYRADGVNMSRWEHPLYQQLLAASEGEIDRNKRLAIFHQAELLLMEEMPVIPIYFKTICFAKKKSVKDVYVSELNQILFKWAYLDEH